jgi:hypothetical protein
VLYDQDVPNLLHRDRLAAILILPNAKYGLQAIVDT